MKKIVIIIVGILILFLGLLYFFGEDTLNNEEMTTARNEVDSIWSNLMDLEISIVDDCESIYGKENSEYECKDYYEGIEDTKTYIRDFKKVLTKNKTVLREPYEESVDIINKSIEVISKANDDLEYIKEYGNADLKD